MSGDRLSPYFRQIAWTASGHAILPTITMHHDGKMHNHLIFINVDDETGNCTNQLCFRRFVG